MPAEMQALQRRDWAGAVQYVPWVRSLAMARAVSIGLLDMRRARILLGRGADLCGDSNE